jgi:lysophospholipase L1-like esterase
MAKLTNKDLEISAIKNYLLPFLNLQKKFPLLPGAKTLKGQATLIGIDESVLSEARQHLVQIVKTAALDLLKQEDIIEQIEKLPFKDGETVLVIGDSLTDDMQGWFEILRHVVELSSTSRDLRFINAAIYGSTSIDALRNSYRALSIAKPTWVIIALGSIDAQRLHSATDRTLVSMAEFWENLNSLEQIIAEFTPNPVIWITPPPAITELMQDMPLFEGTLDESDLASYREIITGKPGFIVDPSGKRMGMPPQAWNYLADGFHPSVIGHIETVKEFLMVMSSDTKVVNGADLRNI